MKIGQLYNIDQFKKFLDSGKKEGFTDSYAGTVLERNLTGVDPQIFEKKFPELAFISSGIDVDNTGGYVKRIQSLRTIALGGFRTAGDTDDNKGKISLTAEESFLKVVEREANSDWSDTEIKTAELQGINLVSKFLEAHNMLYLREVDLIGYTGQDAASGEGLLNWSGFTSAPAGATIDSLSAAQQYAAFSTLINEQRSAVNNTPEYTANRVDMPVRVLNFLSKTILDSTASPASVLAALQGNFPGVEFRGTFRADTIANGGDLATSATVAYNNGNQAMKMRIPEALTVGEIIKSGSFKHSVDSKYRIAGLDVLDDTAGQILTGL
jgi:hypothetical protein